VTLHIMESAFEELLRCRWIEAVEKNFRNGRPRAEVLRTRGAFRIAESAFFHKRGGSGSYSKEFVGDQAIPYVGEN